MEEVDLDDDDDDDDYEAEELDNEVGEEFDEEYEEEEEDDEDAEEAEEADDPAPRRATAADLEEDDEEQEEEEEEEEVDGLGDDATFKQLFVQHMQETREQRKATADTNKLLKKLLAREATPQAGRAPRTAPTGRAPRTAARPAPPTSLPLDGVSHLFGPVFRKRIIGGVAPQWFKHVGVRDILLPYSTTAPIAMRAGGLDPTITDDRVDFDAQYKQELSKVQSKVKQASSNIFVDQLLTLFQLPPIVDAGSANPPNIIAHTTALKALRDPPSGFSRDDPKYKHSASWHAAMDARNNFMNFETAQSRKLFQVDFFSRMQAKGVLQPAAQRWNLGSLAYFTLYTNARLTIKTSAGGRACYGNLKDGADAIAEIERICAWLMDPVECPTTWPVLLQIREQNPLYGQGTPPTVA